MQPSNAARQDGRHTMDELHVPPNNTSPEVSEDESDEIDENDEIGYEINKPTGLKERPSRIPECLKISPSKIIRSLTPEPESRKKSPEKGLKVEYIKTSLNKAIPLLITNNLLYTVAIGFTLIVACMSLNTTELYRNWFLCSSSDYVEDKIELFGTCAYRTKQNFNNQQTEIFEFVREATTLPSVLTIIFDKGDNESQCIATSMKKCFYDIFKPSEIPIELSGRLIKENERFEFFEEYKPKLEKSKFMLVSNLEGLSGEVAENFYSLCDLDNPAVPDTMIVFTLNVGDYFYKHTNSGKKARLFLENLWKDLHVSSRGPLITRLTSNVVEVTQEPGFSCRYFNN